MIAPLFLVQQSEYHNREARVAKARAMDRPILIQRVKSLVEADATKSSTASCVAWGGKASATSIWS
jgi:hypothetical protein